MVDALNVILGTLGLYGLANLSRYALDRAAFSMAMEDLELSPIRAYTKGREGEIRLGKESD